MRLNLIKSVYLILLTSFFILSSCKEEEGFPTITGNWNASFEHYNQWDGYSKWNATISFKNDSSGVIAHLDGNHPCLCPAGTAGNPENPIRWFLVNQDTVFINPASPLSKYGVNYLILEYSPVYLKLWGFDTSDNEWNLVLSKK